MKLRSRGRRRRCELRLQVRLVAEINWQEERGERISALVAAGRKDDVSDIDYQEGVVHGLGLALALVGPVQQHG